MPRKGASGSRPVGIDVRTGLVLRLRRVIGRGGWPGPDLAGPQLRQPGARLAALDRHHRVHQPQPLERVPGVPDLAVEQRGQVLLHVGPGERGAAEHHRPAPGHVPRVQLGQVVPHHHGRLDQQAGHPDDVRAVLLGRCDDGRDGLLDPDVDDVVAVVGQDDVDQVLADVVHVALDRGEHDLALALLAALLHVRLEVSHRRLHHLGGGQHERQLHLPRAEQLADRLHAVKQHVVDDLQGGPLGQPRVQVGLEPGPLAVDDPPLQPLPQRQRGQFGGAARLELGRVHPLEQIEQPGQRIVALAPPVVDQVERHLTLLIRYPGDRHDPRRVHDGGVQPGAHAFGQEDGVEHRPGGGLEPERDVRDTQGGLDVRIAALQLGDRLDGLDAVAPGLLLPGGNGERQAVDDDVLDPHPPVAGQILDQPLGDGDLPLSGPRLAALVDGKRDHGGTVLAHQRHDPGDARVGPVAVLVVDRVDDRATAGQLQPGLDHGRLGRVEDQRQGRGGGEPARDLSHVGDAVPAHVVHAHVEQVRAVPGLGPCDPHAILEPALEHRITEGLGPVGVGPLADGQERGVLPERHVLVERGHAGLAARPAPGEPAVRYAVRQHGDVLRGGAAAAAHQGQAELPGEPVVGIRELRRGQRVARAVRGEDGQAGVRLAGDRDAGVRGQVAQVLAHLAGTGGAVKPDHVDAERLQRGQRRADLAAEQHRPGCLDRDLGDDQRVRGQFGYGSPGPDDGRLGLQQVLAGLDDQRVGTAA